VQFISKFLVSHQALPSSYDDGAWTIMSNYKNWLRNVYEFDMCGIDTVLGQMPDGTGQ
jgi:hypothetical protein